MNYQNYIWDLGGTLLDNYEISAKAFRETLEEYGRPVPAHDEVYAALKISTAEAISRYAADLPDFLEHYKYHEGVDLANPILFKGAKETLEQIVSSGGRNFLWSHRNNQVLDILAVAGIDHFFEEVVTGDSGFPRKPDPSALLYLKDKYQMADALVIGDREIDLEAGRAAGMAVYHFDGQRSLQSILE
ncbi:HAD-IA family hydrolase [Streptococcus moroccensis]|uniref:Phosphoglycolate phosphatase-like HAD superfamily hydrolase n=1 Tax=Streptococcus moroccensis TaxID=1451356 RepID=A0ABT9YTH4_9STRE|nr:HAD-IA family hydrolase [Streptococcus moroccensis]MDQ0223273.1 phosphoglycolate phosphatase-like HAD superfamily hydrolase [Streptococcus moroccensis]